jgi:hypothetical protein
MLKNNFYVNRYSLNFVLSLIYGTADGSKILEIPLRALIYRSVSSVSAKPAYALSSVGCHFAAALMSN